jgi:hypothetical protein
MTAHASAPPPENQPAPNVKGGTNVQAEPELPDTTVGDGFRVDSDSGDGTIGASVGQPGSGRRTPGPISFTGASQPRCTHRPATYGEFPNVVSPDSNQIPDPTAQTARNHNGRAETGWVRTCNNTTNPNPNPFYWAPATIDPIDLIPDALANARTQLHTPTPDINPDATAGGIVNLGMWLAIDDPGTTIARATLANVWAQVTANATSISIDLGNGDVVDCDGLGTPIPDSALDSADQGPCGYTYRTSSPDDDPYQLTITTNYTIGYTTSNGTTGTLSPITRSTTINYDVDEIQTIGISN